MPKQNNACNLSFTALRNSCSYSKITYQVLFQKDELIEVSYKDQIILSYCDKSKVARVGYEIVIVILEEKEKLDLFKLKTSFIKFARDLLSRSKDDRKKYFNP